MHDRTRRLSCDTPIGALSLVQQDDQIVAVDWGRVPPTTTPLLREASRQLRAYFAGALFRFDLPIAPAGTDFQKSVWRAMLDIPYGATATYGDIAAKLSSAARPVGVACGRNPIPVIIPCHRVVGAGGRLTGYSGAEGIRTKAVLIDLESGGAGHLSYDSPAIGG